MNKLSINKQVQAGFTLIELIVVIVILGILAATALPKFATLGGDARYATLKAAQGALASTSAMAHAKYLVNTSGTALVSTTVEGKTITFTTGTPKGYAVADTGLQGAAGLDTDYTIVTTGAATSTTPLVPANAFALVPNSIAGSTTAVGCHVLYTEPSLADTPPTITVVGSADACK